MLKLCVVLSLVGFFFPPFQRILPFRASHLSIRPLREMKATYLQGICPPPFIKPENTLRCPLSPLCRAYKTIEDDDLKFPLIYGEGKKVRGALAATC